LRNLGGFKNLRGTCALNEITENIIPGEKQVSSTRKFFLKVGGLLAVILHPCFLFFYCFVILQIYFVRGAWDAAFWKLFVIVLGFTVVLPAIFPIIYAKDAFLKDRKKRPVTLLFTLLCYIGCLIWLYSFYPVPDLYSNGWSVYAPSNSTVSILLNNYQYIIILELSLYLLSLLIIGLAMNFIISFWFKISLHANGIGFILALLLISNAMFFNWNTFWIISAELIIILLSGILIWQRIASGAHSKNEVIAGLLSGFFTILIIFFLIGLKLYFSTSLVPTWHTTILPPHFHFPGF
jgi:hypothetical protein